MPPNVGNNRRRLHPLAIFPSFHVAIRCSCGNRCTANGSDVFKWECHNCGMVHYGERVEHAFTDSNEVLVTKSLMKKRRESPAA